MKPPSPPASAFARVVAVVPSLAVRCRLVPALCLAVLALAACEKPRPANADHNVTIVVPGANGGSITVGDVTPTNLPPYVKVFPGAKVTASTTSAQGGLLALETHASPDAVIDFYKQSASDAGLPLQMDSASMAGGQGSHIVVFGGDRAHETLTATVTAEGGVTKVALLYGQS
jgi:hypothetical protein